MTAWIKLITIVTLRRDDDISQAPRGAGKTGEHAQVTQLTTVEKFFGHRRKPVSAKERTGACVPCVAAHRDRCDTIRDGDKGQSVVGGVRNYGYCKVWADMIAHAALGRANMLVESGQDQWPSVGDGGFNVKTYLGI